MNNDYTHFNTICVTAYAISSLKLGSELNTLKPTSTTEGTSVVCSHLKRETSLSDVPLDKAEGIDSSANDDSPEKSKISMEGKTLEGPHYPEKGISINIS